MVKNIIDWIDARIPMTATYNRHVGQYPTPKNFNFWYFFGVTNYVIKFILTNII